MLCLITLSKLQSILMINKLERIIAIEQKRYEKKGQKNTFIGLALLFGIVWESVTLGKLYWPEKIEEKETFLFFWSFVCHEACLVITFLLYLPGYMSWSDYFAKHLINKKSLRPWERRGWSEVLVKTITNLIITQLFVLPIAIYLTHIRFVRVRFNDFPDIFELTSQIVFVFVIDDFLSYWGHRMSHSNAAFYKMHKVHHQFDSLFTWATEYSHPVEYISANLLPSVTGFLILGSSAHCFTYFFWTCLKMLMITEGHAGYEFKWSPLRVIPLIADPSYHDYHHSQNVGNFAANCYFWDLLFDTNTQYMNDFLKS